jgi:hypothetical protein
MVVAEPRHLLLLPDVVSRLQQRHLLKQQGELQSCKIWVYISKTMTR